MSKKNQIHEFNPLIYPCRLWIAISKDTFKERFDGVSEWDDGCDAIVDCVNDIQRNLGGVLVRFENRKAMNAGNISHESSHIAMEIFRYIGAEVELSNQEPFSYLVGWIADCINQVKTGKFKD